MITRPTFTQLPREHGSVWEKRGRIRVYSSRSALISILNSDADDRTAENLERARRRIRRKSSSTSQPSQPNTHPLRPVISCQHGQAAAPLQAGVVSAAPPNPPSPTKSSKRILSSKRSVMPKRRGITIHLGSGSSSGSALEGMGASQVLISIGTSLRRVGSSCDLRAREISMCSISCLLEEGL
jgi:hypothetical protein